MGPLRLAGGADAGVGAGTDLASCLFPPNRDVNGLEAGAGRGGDVCLRGRKAEGAGAGRVTGVGGGLASDGFAYTGAGTGVGTGAGLGAEYAAETARCG